jgi:hypothetical protein
MIEQALELSDFHAGMRGLLFGGPGKYEGLRPFEAWLAEHVLGDSSWQDDSTGDVDFGRYYARAGRRIVSEDAQGFVYVDSFATESEAVNAFAQQAADYDAWWDEFEQEEDEHQRERAQLLAYRHARWVRDTDEHTASAFADFVAVHNYSAEGLSEAEASQYLGDWWIAFMRDRSAQGA